MGVTIPPWVPPVTPGGTLNGQPLLKTQLETIAAASTAIPIVYGECMVGGRVFAATYTGGTWYVGALFCVGEIDSYVNLYLNDAAPVSGVTVTYYIGTTAQTADATLAAQIAGYTDTLVVSTAQGSVGIAYVVLAYSDAHYSGFPSIKARIKGRKVYATSANLSTNSEDITAAAWALANVDTGRTANATTAPDGNLTADKLTEATTTSNTHTISGPVISASLADYQTCTWSVYVKASERTFIRLAMVTKSGGVPYATFDLTNVLVLNTNGAAYLDGGIIDVGNGWRRAWITVNIGTGGTSVRGRIILASNATTVTYAGTVGSGAFVWGAHFEAKATPGVYAATTTTATARAFSENPAYCLRDLIADPVIGLGDDTNDLTIQAAGNECDALVIAEKRRRMALVLDDPRAASDWIDTLSAYAGCWTWKRGASWVTVPDRPALIYQFAASAQGWTATNATLTTNATTLTVTQTAADVFLWSPTGLNICGASARYIRCRLRRTSGSGAFDGSIYWQTALHADTAAYRASSTWTATNGTYAVLEWDMHAPTAGGVEWRESIITRIRLDLSLNAGADVWEIDWIAVGVTPITTSNILSDTFSVSVADTVQSPTVVKCRYTDTSTTPWREREAEAILTGVSTGTVPRRESQIQMPGVRFYSQAWREASERLLKLQRTTQVQFVTFDEGWQIERGDVLSIIHPYLNTTSAVENDDATLFRVVDVPVEVSPGRIRVSAVAYSSSDYDNTEPTVTWKAAPTLLGALDVGRSGDGINRIHGRFAGAFAAADPNGQFPVLVGANITSASVGYGNGTTTGPTAGYYGQYALKISTAASGTDRVVWFGSSATDYNIAVDPNSQWIFSGKFWPTIANTSVSFSLKSSAGTTYTLTDTTSTALAWNTFVHTATGSNLLDLSADASDKAIMRMDVGAASAWVAWDGLMLEKKVSNGVVPSPWRPPVASATNPARLSPRLVSAGMLDDNVNIDDGNGNSKQIVAGVLTGTVTDGASVTFSPTFARVPTVQFNPTALTYNSGYSASSHALVCEARSLTTSGFTAYIKVRQLAATITNVTDTTPTDGGASAVPRYTIQKSSALEAWDDRYTFTFDVTVKNNPSYEPGFGIGTVYEPGQVTVGVYIATADSGSPNFTPTWTLVGSLTVGGVGGTSATTSRTGRTITVVRDGLTQRGGTTPEFGIVIASEAVAGGTLTFTNVTYATATAPTETSATAAGVAAVPYTVLPS